MMQEMTHEQIAQHDARMTRLRAQMPPDVLQAIRTLRSWITLPDYWDEAIARAEAASWFVCERLDIDGRPLSPGGEKQ